MSRLGIFLMVLCLTAQAQVPLNPKIGDFQELIANSPFKVDKVEVAPLVSQPLNNNYTLRGVSRFDDGWRVTLIDVKNPAARIRIDEGKPNNQSGIRIVKVNQDTEDIFKTTVDLMVSGRKVTVGYNTAELKKRRASSVKAAAKPAIKRPVTNNAQNPPLPHELEQSKNNQDTKSVRRPRVRRVAPTQ